MIGTMAILPSETMAKLATSLREIAQQDYVL